MVVLLGEKTTDSSFLLPLFLLLFQAMRIWIWTGVNMINSYALSPNGVHGCRPPPPLGDGCGGISRPAGTL